MIAILIAVTSLLTQAYFFRDIDNSESGRDSGVLEDCPGETPAGFSACRWPAESDSSRTAGTAGDR